MALEYVDTNGSFVIPGAYPSVTVQPNNSGLSATGVLMLVGEAEAGPAFDQESDLSQNLFTADQVAAVVAKYKQGPLVEAFAAATSASADPGIAGSFAGAILAKTNVSVKATSDLKNPDGSGYQTLADKSYGKLGNLTYYKVEAAAAESLPTTGSFHFCPPIGTVAVSFRVNGGTALTPATLTAGTLPPAFVTAVNTQAGVKAAGGALRGDVANGVVGGTPNVAVAVNGNVVTLTVSTAWVQTNPLAVGDLLYIPSGSEIDGPSSENAGSYIITAFTNTTITALKVANGAGAVGAALVAPVAVAATAVASGSLNVYAPVTVGLDSATQSTLVQGLGKSLEFAELTTGTDLLSRFAFGTNGQAVSFISKSGAPTVIGSAQEYVASLSVNRQVDNVQEVITAGDSPVFAIGYKGTDACTATVTAAGFLTTSVSGGVGGNLNINLKDFPTVADLAAYVSVQPGYSAVVPSPVQGNTASVKLDKGTYNIATEHGAAVGRIKADAYKFFNAVSKNSTLVQVGVGVPAPAQAGLPAVTTGYVFLSGGAKGATSTARVTAAIDALERVRGNFLVPLFSRDAGNVVEGDIADGLTDSGSTYKIDEINAYAKNHVIKLSTVKRRRNRQAFLSKRDSFVKVQNAAATIAHYRCAMTFEDDKTATSNGIVQFGPWMTAVKAAAMQAAGFYKSLVHKYVNTSGVLQAAGDWTYNDDGNLEAALKAGLLPVGAAPGGGFYFISDQTTYGKDSNFVFNSIQMVYSADIVALTTAQRMEQAFVGQSLADVSAAQALSYLDGIMSDFRRLKLIAYSDDAPLGYRNAKIVINGPAMQVSVEVKIAGSIYFIPISFFVTQITQTAGSK